MDDLVRQLPTPYMLLGDFNNHNPLWGGNTLDGKGQRVEQFMDNHSLCFLNDGSYTYLHPGYRTYTAIDLTITQPNLLLDFSWRVLDDLFGSDHFPIVVKHQGPATGGREPGWRLKKADWHSFHTLCDERQTADSIHNSSEAIASFTDTLISIADWTVPKSSATPKHVINPWLDADCEKAIKDQKKAERKFNRQPTAENLTTFKIKRAMARRVIKEKRRQCWRHFVSSINNRTPLSKVWRLIRRLKGKGGGGNVQHLKCPTPQTLAQTFAHIYIYQANRAVECHCPTQWAGGETGLASRTLRRATIVW